LRDKPLKRSRICHVERSETSSYFNSLRVLVWLGEDYILVPIN
jgi:hypothetical protein